MVEKSITGITTWLKQWFYSADEIDVKVSAINSALTNKVNLNQGEGSSNKNVVTDASGNITVEAKPSVPTKTSDLVNDGDDGTNVFVSDDDGRLSDARTPKTHASTGTTYGVGTGSNYGHNKVIDNLNQSSNVDGLSLSAHQGYVLKELIDEKSDFSGSYNDLTDKPSTFTPSAHNQASTTITEDSALSNIGTSANATQHTINEALNNIIGDLSSIKAIEVVTTLPTESASTMGKLYIINEDGAVNVYYTEQTGTGSSATYSWHNMDADILDELSIDWSDITNKPSTFAPSSHTHGNIGNDGTLTSPMPSNRTYEFVVVDTTDNEIHRKSSLSTEDFKDPNRHTNIGTSGGYNQSLINTAIDTAVGTINTNMVSKGALVDDIDWSYNENGFVNGIKLHDKTSTGTDANGTITFHLKTSS